MPLGRGRSSTPRTARRTSFGCRTCSTTRPPLGRGVVESVGRRASDQVAGLHSYQALRCRQYGDLQLVGEMEGVGGDHRRCRGWSLRLSRGDASGSQRRSSRRIGTHASRSLDDLGAPNWPKKRRKGWVSRHRRTTKRSEESCPRCGLRGGGSYHSGCGHHPHVPRGSGRCSRLGAEVGALGVR